MEINITLGDGDLSAAGGQENAMVRRRRRRRGGGAGEEARSQLPGGD